MLLVSVMLSLLFAPDSVLPRSPETDCVAAIDAQHVVRTPEQETLQIYRDVELVRYLTQLGVRAGLPSDNGLPTVVFPVYSPDPLLFDDGHHVYVSTGFILLGHNDDTLVMLLREIVSGEHTHLKAGAWSPCALLPGEGHTFPVMRAKLERQIARYERWVTPHLKARRNPRDTPAQHHSRDQN